MNLPKYVLFVIVVPGLVLVSLSFTNISFTKASSPGRTSRIDSVKVNVSKAISPHPLLASDLYQKALQGFRLISSGDGLKKNILTIVDLSKPSSEKRLFIIDMQTEKLLMHTYVAHGRNSGENKASRFSNADGSHQSSLGFYLTGSTYSGSNGYSMRLKGLEKGFNDNAERRSIVMHGATYVSEDVIHSTGRLGRSWGCPAVSQKEHKQIIDLIKDGSCLFVYAPEKAYLSRSVLIKEINDSTPIL